MTEKNDVFPSRDADFDIFQKDLISECQSHAVMWDIDPDQLTDLAPYKADWEAKWAAASDKSNRTPVQTRLKDLARAAYETVLRPFIKGLYINPSMNAADIEACGLKPHETTRTPVPVPTMVPVTVVTPLPGHRSKLEFTYQNQNGVVSKGKPRGVAFCEIAYKIGGDAPVNPDACPLKLATTRSRDTVEFETEEAGQKVYYFARYINPRLEPGPWSNVGTFIVS